MGNLDLEVQLGAKLADFERGMDDAVGIAERAVSEIENRFSGMSLIAVSGLAVAAGSFSALLMFAKNVNSELADMDRNARQVGLSVERFQSVKFAAAVGGVGSDGFVDGLQKSVALLNDAQRNSNTLSQLFAANGLQIADNNGKLISTNELLNHSANLISRAATEQDKIKIAQMLGFTREWVPVLESGAGAFNDLASEAERAGAIIDSATIAKAKEFDDAWKKSSIELAANFKAVFADVAIWVSGLIEKARQFADLVSAGYQKIRPVVDAWTITERDREGMQQDPDQVQRVLDSYRTRENPDEEIVARLEKIRDRAIEAQNEQIKAYTIGGRMAEGARDRLGSKSPTKLRVDGMPGPKTVVPARNTGSEFEGRDPFDAAIDGANRRIAILNAETATLGQNSEARERARLVAVLEEAAKRANTAAGLENTAVTAEQRVEIERLASAMETAAQRNRLMSEALANFRDLGNAAAEAFRGLVIEGRKFDDVLSQLLSRLGGRLIDQGFNALFSSAGSSLFGGMFGSGGGTSWSGAFNPTGGPLSFGGPRAAGGPVTPGEWYMVGERGPEPFVPHTPGSILPNDVLRGGSNVTAPVTVSIDARGADAAGLARLEMQLARLQQNLPALVVQSVRGAQDELRL